MTEKLPVELLRKSQKEVARLLVDNHAFAVFSDMGFGKTASVITAIERLIKSGDIKKVLVVTTKKVAEYTWPAELSSWEHARGLRCSPIKGTPSQRIKAASLNAEVYIIGQELFVWLAERAGKKWPYDMVVFDDVSGFSTGVRKSKASRCAFDRDCPMYSPGAPYGCKWAFSRCDYSLSCKVSSSCSVAAPCGAYKEGPRRFTRFGAFCALRPQIKRVVQLTGTPTNKDLLDLWPLIFSLDGGRRLGRTLTAYKNKYFVKDHNGFSWSLREGAGVAIARAIKDLCAAIPSEAKLPPCKSVTINVELPDNANALYKELAQDMFLETENGTVDAANAGVLIGKLLQVCGGAVFKTVAEGAKKEWIPVHDEKIKAVKKIMDKHPGEPLLIGYNFTHELERLRLAFPQGVELRDINDVVNKWNSGKIPILFTHPRSAGHGLNLQKGPGRLLIWFGLNWDLKLNLQLNKRLHRPGQKREVYIYYLVVPGKADTEVVKGVTCRGYTQKQLLKAVTRGAKKLIFNKG